MSMSLYEINADLEALLNAVEIDIETGEVISAPDWDSIEELSIKREEKIDGLISYIKSVKAMISAIKEQENALVDRRKKKERHLETTMEYLEHCLAGDTFENERHKISYRKSNTTEIMDEAAAVEWLAENGHEDCLKLPDQTLHIAKTSVAKLIGSGVQVPGVEVVQHLNM